MPKDQKTHMARGRPISCRFCRARKLRCSREAPCTNCISRGIECDLVPPARPSAGIVRASESELLERIRKLEELLQEKSQRTGSRNARSRSLISDRPPRQGQDSNVSLDIEHLDNDVAWLASIYSSQDISDKTAPNKIVFRVCSIHEIPQAQPFINQNTCFDPIRCVWLPQYSEAKILVEKFIRDIDHVHHIVHTPSLPAILDELYACLDQQGHVKPGSMLLLLGIFASATHAWIRSDSELGLFATCSEANIQSPRWVKAIEDVLDIAHRTTGISVEGLQGLTITIFVLLNMEGFSRRCKSMFNMVFHLGRELGLHQLDHTMNANNANKVQAEIGRRTWWYLVACDWSVPSKLSGLGQGVYTCHPRHMMVKRPLNINDEDLIEGIDWMELPISQPTTMSYPLYRLRLAEISRRTVDRTPISMANNGGPSHEIVMDIDTDLQELIDDLPAFFSMSLSELIATHQLAPPRAADIVHQGYMFRSLFYAQRCTLHFPYFSRGFVDSAYATSQDICLLSARKVIQTETELGKLRIPATRYRFLGCLVSTFLATIIVLMDLCHNKSASQQEKEREEIADAIQILEDARLESETTAKFLDSLIQVLRRHKVLPTKEPEQHPNKAGACSKELSTALLGVMSPNAVNNSTFSGIITPGPTSTPIPPSNVLWCNDANNINMPVDTSVNGGEVNLSFYFNELAQSFEQGMDVESFDWNNLLSGFDSSIV